MSSHTDTPIRYEYRAQVIGDDRGWGDWYEIDDSKPHLTNVAFEAIGHSDSSCTFDMYGDKPDRIVCQIQLRRVR